MPRSIVTVTCILLGGFVLSGCGSSRSVSRIEPNETVDLSGDWNDTDSRLVAEEMISDALSRPWLGDFKAA
jgi:PBP1b-binding outer membrane lipoprotein LpoB